MPKLKLIFTAVALLCSVSLGAAELTLEERIAKGYDLAVDRNAGNCFSCHMAEGAEQPGNSGPALIMMQLRYPDRNQLKAQIADPRVRNPNTNMPPYGAHYILTDQELEWMVDFVHSL
ncbi:MAG: sulfur oxidation c-type cytochrome SoxX [Halieaceae bacterium]|jgi:sulfur-oxidizing protein SoxX|nr:sulfur oxidation c-type cytochrome SoxX [Halieaceae bacterium]